MKERLSHATLADGLDRFGGLDESKATAAHRLSVGRKPGAPGTARKAAPELLRGPKETLGAQGQGRRIEASQRDCQCRYATGVDELVSHPDPGQVRWQQ